MTVSTPERYHQKNHHDGRVPFDECWRCGRARATCRSKRRYETREDAEQVVTEINEGERYARPITRYLCRWCLNWHLTQATTKMRARRAERARRKWLAKSARV
jgi:ribosomal protein S26